MKPHASLVERALRVTTIVVAIGVVGNAALALAVSGGVPHQLLRAMRPDGLVLAGVLALVPWFTNTVRLRQWCAVLGKRLTFRSVFGIVLGTELGAALTPTALGGGPARVALLMRCGFGGGASASLATVTSIENLLAFAILLPIAVVIAELWHVDLVNELPAQIPWPATAGIVIAIAILAVIVRRVTGAPQANRVGRPQGSLRKRGRAALGDFIAAYRVMAATGPTVLPRTVALAMVQWVCRYSVISAILFGLGVSVDPVLLFALQWVVFTLGTFIPSPGAAGGIEAGFVLVHAGIVPAEALGVATALWRFFTFYQQLIIGSVILPWALRDTRDKESPQSTAGRPASGPIDDARHSR